MKRVVIFLVIAGLTKMFTFGQQQDVQVSGTVTDAIEGKPLPGALILVKGTDKGRVTDINGKYSLNVPTEATLQFSFVGMYSQEIDVGDRQEIDVIMNTQKQYRKAGINDEHLEPVSVIFDIFDYQFEYYSKVRQVLFNGLTDYPEIRFLVMPSFTPENVLDIEFNRDNNKYYLKYHICDKNIWYNTTFDKVNVNKFSTEIDKESVEKIKSLFSIAIAQVRFSPAVDLDEDVEIIIRTDGIRYYFTNQHYGLKTGTTHSPDKGTKMKKLVDIG
jgi:hypothetical protein